MEVKDTVEILDPGMVCLNPLLLFWRPNPADDITSLETQPAVTPKPTVLFWMIRHLYPSTYRLTDRLFFSLNLKFYYAGLT